MSASTLSARSNPIEMEKKTHSFALGADHSAQDSSGALPAEPTAAARQVLGTLLKVIDQADKPERSQVELKFDFGQETLAVRVAMKGGEVHTVFQTSSHELRVHLAQQWHDFTSQLPESARTQPDPVFTHSSSSSLHWSHQDASSGRHHSDTSREPAFTTSAPSGDAPEGDEIATARPAPLPRGQSLLNTLA